MWNGAGYIEQLRALLARIDAAQVQKLADVVYDAWRDGRRVFIFGNGGSASTASHWACDLAKTAAVEGKPILRAISLTDNIGLLTALGNDVSYDEIFRYPLAAQAQRGDVAVAISCSGNSPSVLRACAWARENGVRVVAVSGYAGGKMKDLCDLHVNIPSDNFGLVEDLHLAVGHMVAQALKCRVEKTQ